jgi:hypothetical protein
MRPGPDKIVLDMLLSLKANLLDAEQDDLWLDLLLDTPEAEIIKIRTHFRANPPHRQMALVGGDLGVQGH